MKKLTALLLLVSMVAIGCGPSFDESKAAPVQSEEDMQQEIQQAIDSGDIDPATYGQEAGDQAGDQ